MSKGIDQIADSLAEVAADGDLERVRIAAVEETEETVDLVLELPSCDRFTHTFQKPPVWGTNCELERLLSVFDVDPDTLQELSGERVPCTRTVENGSLQIEVDLDELGTESTSKAVTPDGFGDLEL